MDANDACVTACFGYNPFTYDPNDPYNPGDGTITLPYTYEAHTYTYDPDTFVRPRRCRLRHRRRRRCATAPTAVRQHRRGRRRLRQRRRLPAVGSAAASNECVGAQFDASDDCCFRRSEDDRYDAPPQYGGSAADGDSAAESRSTTMC